MSWYCVSSLLSYDLILTCLWHYRRSSYHFVYIICNRDYRSYLIFKLIINLLFESKQVSFSSQYSSSSSSSSSFIVIAMNQAKKFLKKNLTESQVVAAKIFNVNRKSLNVFIKRDSDAKHKRHNKMLQNHEINTFDDFIRSYLKHEILFINEIIFSVIMRLKRTHRLKTSSKKWFRDWWKKDHLHKIETKSLSIIRFEVDHEEAIIEWSLKYKNTLRILNIRVKTMPGTKGLK
jgi:hypothetical protein